MVYENCVVQETCLYFTMDANPKLGWALYHPLHVSLAPDMWPLYHRTHTPNHCTRESSPLFVSAVCGASSASFSEWLVSFVCRQVSVSFVTVAGLYFQMDGCAKTDRLIR